MTGKSYSKNGTADPTCYFADALKKTGEGATQLNFLFSFQVPISISSELTGWLSPLHFYEEKERKWKSLSKFDSMFHVPSLIVVDETLYAVGGLEKDIEVVEDENGFTDERDIPSTKNRFLQYDSVNNQWDNLLPIMVARQQVILVHLDGFIYAIAGKDADGNQKCDVE